MRVAGGFADVGYEQWCHEGSNVTSPVQSRMF